jgi:hypothetical protein
MRQTWNAIAENTLIGGGCDNVVEVDDSGSELVVTPRDPKPTNKKYRLAAICSVILMSRDIHTGHVTCWTLTFL